MESIIARFPFMEDKNYQAILATVFISLSPFFILFFLPIKFCHPNSRLLRFLLAFAVGSLLGDSFLHLIPHSIESTDFHKDDHSHHHSHSAAFGEIAYPFFLGLLMFYVAEVIIRCYKRQTSQCNFDHKKKDIELQESEPNSENKNIRKNKKISKINKPNSRPHQNTYCGSGGHDESQSVVESDKNDNLSIKIGAYLNLASDFFHNMMDGLAIGSSFYVSTSMGLATTFSVFFHEIPHEISDFAILVKSGYSKWQAIFLQLLTAIGALSGTFLGIYLASNNKSGESMPTYLLPLTAGGFTYIALVSVVPELLKMQKSLFQAALEIIGIFLGVGIMDLLAAYIH